ncbi:YjgF-like protein [Paxillus ammoniavirescens]|nr:YjgF-like protein [Paxillus ammoniavirescens]
MSKQIVNNVPGAVPALPIFSQAVISKGHVYLSGSIGCDKEYNIVGGIHEQTRAALENMKKVLEGAGSGLEHVVKVNVYLANLVRDFAAMNEVYEQFFTRGAMPARTCVGVAALPVGGFVEIECIAELPPCAQD